METNSFESSSVTTSSQQLSDTSTGGDYRSSSSGCSCTCSADEISFPSFSAGEETQESASNLSSQRLQRSHQSSGSEAGQQDDSSLARVDILTSSSDDQAIRSPLVDLDKRNLIGCAENGNRTHHTDVTAGAENLSDNAESHSNDSQQILGVVDLCSEVHISSNSVRFATYSSDLDYDGSQTLEDKVLRLRQEMRIVEEKIDHARRSFAERQQQTESLNKLLSLLRRQELLRTVQRLRMQLARQTTRLQTHSQNLRKLSPTCTPNVTDIESDPFA